MLHHDKIEKQENSGSSRIVLARKFCFNAKFMKIPCNFSGKQNYGSESLSLDPFLESSVVVNTFLVNRFLSNGQCGL